MEKEQVHLFIRIFRPFGLPKWSLYKQQKNERPFTWWVAKRSSWTNFVLGHFYHETSLDVLENFLKHGKPLQMSIPRISAPPPCYVGFLSSLFLSRGTLQKPKVPLRSEVFFSISAKKKGGVRNNCVYLFYRILLLSSKVTHYSWWIFWLIIWCLLHPSKKQWFKWCLSKGTWTSLAARRQLYRCLEKPRRIFGNSWPVKPPFFFLRKKGQLRTIMALVLKWATKNTPLLSTILSILVVW